MPLWDQALTVRLIVGTLDLPAPPDERDPPIRAVLWKDDAVIDLGTLGGHHSWALALNETGQIVGGSASEPPSKERADG